MCNKNLYSSVPSYDLFFNILDLCQKNGITADYKSELFHYLRSYLCGKFHRIF
jgi:hypothetical protein